AKPHLHYSTAPLRAAARAAGDREGIHLWAGQAYSLAEAVPAAELVARWGAQASAAGQHHSRRSGNRGSVDDELGRPALRRLGAGRVPARWYLAAWAIDGRAGPLAFELVSTALPALLAAGA